MYLKNILATVVQMVDNTIEWPIIHSPVVKFVCFGPICLLGFCFGSALRLAKLNQLPWAGPVLSNLGTTS